MRALSNKDIEKLLKPKAPERKGIGASCEKCGAFFTSPSVAAFHECKGKR